MEKIKEVVQKKGLYIFAIICSIYFSYLIYHAYSIGGKASLILAIILSTLSVFLIYLFDKTVDFMKIQKKVLYIIAILSVLISIVILISDFDFFTKKFSKSQVKIIALMEGNNYNNSKEVIISNIIQGNSLEDLSKIKLNEGWKYSKKKVCLSEDKPHELSLSFKKNNHIKIIFETNEKSGKIKIVDGEYEETIDLYSYKSGMYDYTVKSNSCIDSLFWIRAMCSYFMLFFVIFLVMTASYFLFKTKKSIILPTLLLVLVLRMFYYSNLQGYTLYPDSESYIKYNFENLFKLKFPGRTPVYPLVIYLCKVIFGEKLFLNFVVLFQIFVSFIAVIYLYKTLKLMIKNNEIIVGIVTIIYGVTEAICGYDNCILTESLALSGYVFFIYHIIKYIKESKVYNGIIAVMISFVLTFLRPISIILVVLMFVFFVARFLLDKQKIKMDLTCFSVLMVSIVMIGIYSVIFYQMHQIYSISDPTIRQDLFICIDQGFYQASNNKEFIYDIENRKKEVEKTTNLTGNRKIWAIEETIQEKYGNKKVQELTAYCKRMMKDEYVRYLINLVKKSATITYYGYSKLLPNCNSMVLDVQIFLFNIVNFSYVYIMILIEFIVFVYKWIKEKRIPWIHAGIFGFSLTIMIGTFVGTNAEYMRTSIGVVPFFYMSLAIFLDYILMSVGKIKQQKA